MQEQNYMPEDMHKNNKIKITWVANDRWKGLLSEFS